MEEALLPIATPIHEDNHQVGSNLVRPSSGISPYTIPYEEGGGRGTTTRRQFTENVEYAMASRNMTTAVADDSFSRVKQAERKGQIETRIENQAIRHVNRTAYHKNYSSSQAVEIANHRARIRNAEGLQMEDRGQQLGLGQVNSTTNSKPKASTRGGGYEIKEYSTRTDYNTAEYEVKEYRSVYD